MRFCKHCYDDPDSWKNFANKRAGEYGRGFCPGVGDDWGVCPYCGNNTEYVDISSDDFCTIRTISNYNRDMLWAMIDLKKKDIIEYESKMAQFRIQEQQMEANRKKNLPHCPTCGSTNIKKISAASKAAGGLMFGIFSKTARSQFECLNCKCKW